MASVVEPVRRKTGLRQREVEDNGVLLSEGRLAVPAWSLPPDEHEARIEYYRRRAELGLPLFSDLARGDHPERRRAA